MKKLISPAPPAGLLVSSLCWGSFHEKLNDDSRNGRLPWAQQRIDQGLEEHCVSTRLINVNTSGRQVILGFTAAFDAIGQFSDCSGFCLEVCLVEEWAEDTSSLAAVLTINNVLSRAALVLFYFLFQLVCTSVVDLVVDRVTRSK